MISVCLNGNNVIEALNLTPSYTVGVDSSGGGKGGVKQNNAACGSNSNLQGSLEPDNPPPKFSKLTHYEHQEVS